MPNPITGALFVVLLTSTLAVKAFAKENELTVSASVQDPLLALKHCSSASADQMISVAVEEGKVRKMIASKPDEKAAEYIASIATGDVFKQESKTVLAQAGNTRPAISMKQAIDIALSAIPGGSIVEAELDTERGTRVWEVLVRGSSGLEELYIDATTGVIVKRERQ